MKHAYVSANGQYVRRKIWNRIICCALMFSAVIALIPLFSVFGYVIHKGLPAINLDFFMNLPKPIGEEGGGMANSLLGTLMLITIASAIGIPWGVGTGIYLSEYGKGKLGTLVRFSADVLSSVPSIVIGLFAYALIVIPMKRFSALAGGAALGIIMIPTVARTTEELLKLVPVHIREAGLALGLPRWKVILRIILRGAKNGIVTGIILALARISGETAPLIFTALNNRFWSFALDQPTASLPVQIYSYAVSPYEEWHKQAWAGAFLLLIVVFLLNAITRILLREKK
jgi:phosphate transport system permease protein